MQVIFLEKEIRKLQKKCDVKKGDLWLLFELVTHLTINHEITLYDAERYTAKLYKMLEEVGES
jgi:hypothetical protein